MTTGIKVLDKHPTIEGRKPADDWVVVGLAWGKIIRYILGVAFMALLILFMVGKT